MILQPKLNGLAAKIKWFSMVLRFLFKLSRAAFCGGVLQRRAAGACGSGALQKRQSGVLQRYMEVSTRRSVCDWPYHFFAVSCPGNSAFFRKNRQIFENIPRKILHILNVLEKCCILEKSRKNLVTFGENSAKFWQNLRIFGKKAEKKQHFLTKFLRD